MAARERREPLWMVLLVALMGCTALGTSDQRGRLADGGDVVDIGVGTTDAGVDTGTDTNVDTAVDSGTDVGADSGIDVAVDVATDTGTDAMSMCPTGQTLCGGACTDLTSSTTNCGTCGTVCGMTNARPLCSAGTCFPFCTTGFGDCDGSAANGCETNLATDVMDCGACGMVCPALANATPTCAARVCGFTCAMGYSDCDGIAANGCETNLSTSVANCGGCGMACSFANATAACSAATCMLAACSTGYGNCDGVAANGCEVNLTTSGSHCGACGTACGASNVCFDGACVLTCPSPTTACSGSCVNLQTSNTNCGSCGHECAAGRLCMAGTCAACASGLADCDGNPTNACETSTASDISNCGTCGHACPAVANARPVCNIGTCGFACLAGFAASSGACVPVPRAIAPLSTAAVTSQQPTLRWQLPTGADGAQVQICRDRACAIVEQTLDVTGTSARPTTLSPGVHFWQLQSRMGTTVGSASSAVWEFFVGHRSAPVDTSWGTTLDVNGDGLADLAVLAPGAVPSSQVYIYLGGSTGLDSTPDLTLTGPRGAGNAFTNTTSVGDVNGDGFPDLAVAAVSALSGTGQVFIFLGGRAGVATVPSAVLIGPDGVGGYFGETVAGVGDLDGDGFEDVAVGAGSTFSAGRTYVFPGSAAGLATSPGTILNGPDGAGGEFFEVSSAGDVNGDNYGDLAVSARGVLSDTGRVYLYLGSATGIASSPMTTLTGPDGPGGQFAGGSPGDFNGDGYADLAVSAQCALSVGGSPGSCDGYGRSYVFLGGASGLSTAPATTLSGPHTDLGFGETINAGDVNADGYADLAAGDSCALNTSGDCTGTGHVYLFLGSAAGLGSAPETTLSCPDTGTSLFGESVAVTGDLNGDGYADLAVGAYGIGRAYVFLGNAIGVPLVPATTLINPVAGAQFGAVVAMLDRTRRADDSFSVGLTRRPSRFSEWMDAPFAAAVATRPAPSRRSTRTGRAAL